MLRLVDAPSPPEECVCIYLSHPALFGKAIEENKGVRERMIKVIHSSHPMSLFQSLLTLLKSSPPSLKPSGKLMNADMVMVGLFEFTKLILPIVISSCSDLVFTAPAADDWKYTAVPAIIP